jgi:uncharacterized Zn finger protein (UPF0148 family)
MEGCTTFGCSGTPQSNSNRSRRTLECPACSLKLGLPIGKRGKITCPRCGARLEADTTGEQGSLSSKDASPDAARSERPIGNTGLATPEDQHQQIRQLIKQALDAPTPEGLADFLDFTTKFRRLAVWNARMAYIQRPGARVIASEFEWQTTGRHVLPDAVPIIILWPFSPIRFVYELEDTGPPIDRESINDPFAAKGNFSPKALSALAATLKKQKKFKIKIEARRHGFSYAGSAATQGFLPNRSTPRDAANREKSYRQLRPRERHKRWICK